MNDKAMIIRSSIFNYTKVGQMKVILSIVHQRLKRQNAAYYAIEVSEVTKIGGLSET